MIAIRNFVRIVVITIRYWFLTYIYGMHIHKTARISYGARLDKTNPKGIYIAEESYVASGAVIFSHDFSRGLHADTHIGKRCFIGANAIIMCGVTLGDEVIVGAGSIVTKDMPSGSIVAGNPARVIRDGIQTTKFGKIVNHE